MSDQPETSKPTRVQLFFRTHDRVLSVLGAIMVFGTFIARDAIRDSVKDRASSLESARGLFYIRKDLSKIKTDIQFQIAVSAGADSTGITSDVGQQSDMTQWLTLVRPVVDGLPESLRLDDEKKLKELQQKLNTFDSTQSGTKERFVAIANLGGDVNDLSDAVLDQADVALQSRRFWDRLTNWLGIGFYIVGSGITVFSALYGAKSSANP
jgi:hypothetical protein